MGIFAGITLQDLMMWLVCGLFIARWVYYAWQKAKNNDNSYDNYGEYCVTLGVFGTFLGITYSLVNFNASDSKELMNQIPQVIAGMKFAFVTSLEGLLGSITIKWIKCSENENSTSLDELAVKTILDSDKRHKESIECLNDMSESQKQFATEAIEHLSKLDALSKTDFTGLNYSLQILTTTIKNSSQTELANSINKMSDMLAEQNATSKNQSVIISEQTKAINNLLESMSSGLEKQEMAIKSMAQVILSGNSAQKLILETMSNSIRNVEESSQKASADSALMLKNTIEFQEKQNEFSIDQIKQMQQNTAEMQNLASKFDNFLKDMSEKFSDNFIASLRGLIENLNENLTEQFGENFKRLDESVKKLNQWQIENKEEINTLTMAFGNVRDGFTKSLDKTIDFLDKLNAAEQVIRTVDDNIKDLHSTVIELSKEQKLLTESTAITVETAAKMEKAIASVNGMCDFVNAQIETVANNTTNAYKNMLTQTADIHDKFMQSVHDINNTTTNNVKLTCDNMTDTLAKTIGKATLDFNTRSNEITSQLSSSMSNMVKDLKDNQAYITESTLEQFTNIASKMENNTNSIINQSKIAIDSMDAQIKSFETTMTNSMKEIGSKIEEFAIDWDDNITEASSKISAAYTEIAKKNGEEQEKAIITLGKQLSAIAEKMAESYSDLNETLTLLNKQTKNMR